jgi:hypothetical protein
MYTQEMYNALIEAIALGAREVWYGDKRVAYRTLDEMLRPKSGHGGCFGYQQIAPPIIRQFL